MSNEIPKEPEKTSEKKKRSKSYPRFSLEHALNFAETIDAVGGDRISRDTIAAEVGMAINNSSFIGRVSSAKQFGLITVDDGKMSVTSIAKRIFHPLSETDKSAAMVKAFCSPELYRELILKYRGKVLPSSSTLGNVLMHEDSYGIEKNACASAASAFIQSVQKLGLLTNGLLVVPEIEIQSDSADNNAPDDESVDMRAQTAPIKVPSTILPPPPPPSRPSVDNFVFDFDGGIQLIIPKTTATSDAIADGALKDIRASLKSFSENHLAQD